MESRYQRARADGTINWTVGAKDFDTMWQRAFDELRFHRGKGFALRHRPDGDYGPNRTLAVVDNYLQPQLDKGDAGDLIEVKALSDDFRMVFRRVVVQTGGDRIVAHAAAEVGTPYKFGVTDCSWLTMHSYGAEGIDLPHNAHAQHLMFGGASKNFRAIMRDDIKPGDLLFHHNDEHVSIYLDGQGFGRVWDTEPHNTGSPAGWPTSTLGTGVRIRPMQPGYYCDWAHVSGIGRVVSINGEA